jgi:hypothetical protein
VGEDYGGGIVYYVWDNGLHGLIAAKVDVAGPYYTFNNGIDRNTGTTSLVGCCVPPPEIGAGQMNTTLLIAFQLNDNASGSFAALMAHTYFSTDGLGRKYGDWYLPSFTELQEMFYNTATPSLALHGSDSYWSSTETSNTNALSFGLSLGSCFCFKSSAFRVRPIRRF